MFQRVSAGWEFNIGRYFTVGPSLFSNRTKFRANAYFSFSNSIVFWKTWNLNRYLCTGRNPIFKAHCFQISFLILNYWNHPMLIRRWQLQKEDEFWLVKKRRKAQRFQPIREDKKVDMNSLVSLLPFLWLDDGLVDHVYDFESRRRRFKVYRFPPFSVGKMLSG